MRGQQDERRRAWASGGQPNRVRAVGAAHASGHAAAEQRAARHVRSAPAARHRNSSGRPLWPPCRAARPLTLNLKLPDLAHTKRPRDGGAACRRPVRRQIGRRPPSGRSDSEGAACAQQRAQLLPPRGSFSRSGDRARTPMASLPSLWLRKKGFSRFFTILCLTSGVTIFCADKSAGEPAARGQLQALAYAPAAPQHREGALQTGRCGRPPPRAATLY